jgi:hypothetical protein
MAAQLRGAQRQVLRAMQAQIFGAAAVVLM